MPLNEAFDKVYGMLHGVQGLLDEQYVDLSTQIHSELDIELLKKEHRLHFLVPAVTSFRKYMKTEIFMRNCLEF